MNTKFFAMAVVSAFTLSACGTAHFHDEHFLENHQNTKYASVNVRCDDEGAIFPHSNQKLENYIRTYLQQEKISLGDDLLIHCNFVNFRRGSRAARYFGGINGSFNGKGESDLQVELIDAENNKVDEFRIKSLLMFGIFGGNSENMIKNSARKIVNRVKPMITNSPQTTTE